MPDVDPFLEEQGKYLRDLWQVAHRQWHQHTKGPVKAFDPGPSVDGGYDPGTCKLYASAWPRAAKKILEKNMDLEGAVKCAFMVGGPSPPHPSVLFNPGRLARIIDRYEKYVRDEAPVAMGLAYQLQEEAYRTAMSSRRLIYSDDDSAAVSVLVDFNVEMSPLFRYGTAVALGLDRVARKWLPKAVQQYMSYPELYDRCWPCVTADLRRRARELKASLEFMNAEAPADGNEEYEEVINREIQE